MGVAVYDPLLNAPWSTPTLFIVQDDEDSTQHRQEVSVNNCTLLGSARFGSVDKHRYIKLIWCQTESLQSNTDLWHSSNRIKVSGSAV